MRKLLKTVMSVSILATILLGGTMCYSEEICYFEKIEPDWYQYRDFGSYYTEEEKEWQFIGEFPDYYQYSYEAYFLSGVDLGFDTVVYLTDISEESKLKYLNDSGREDLDHVLFVECKHSRDELNQVAAEIKEEYSAFDQVMYADFAKQFDRMIVQINEDKIRFYQGFTMVYAFSDHYQSLKEELTEKYGDKIYLVSIGGTGNVDMDDDITMNDASLILRAALGLYDLNEDERVRADCDGNDKIEVADARWCLNLVLGIPNERYPEVTVEPLNY